MRFYSINYYYLNNFGMRHGYVIPIFQTTHIAILEAILYKVLLTTNSLLNRFYIMTTDYKEIQFIFNW